MSTAPKYYASLHNHTTFSIGDALNFPKEHFEFVIKNAQESAMAHAITDHGNANAFGYIAAAQKEYKNKGIPFKCIYGVEFYLHPDLDEWKAAKDNKELLADENVADITIEDENESKSSKQFDPIKRRHHLVVIAYNQEGLTNLYKLVTYSYRKGFYRFPRIDYKMLDTCKNGLLVSTACVAGIPAYLSLKNKDKGLEATMKDFDLELKPLLDIFGKDYAFLEMQFNKLDSQVLTNLNLIEYSKRTGYKLIVTSDAHYSNQDLWKSREIYKLISRQTKGMDIDKNIPQSIDELKADLYPKNAEQTWQEYKQTFSQYCSDEKLICEAIERSHHISHDLIEFISPDPTLKLPVNRQKDSTIKQLKDLCVKSLQEKNLYSNDKYVERLLFELQIIKDKGLENYFLVLREAVQALKKEMLIGPSRGSAAGSLVNYLLGITMIDPVKNELLFERFLSPSRKELADIDLDFSDKDRVLDVLKEHFGKDNVLPVSNYNTLQLKSLVKDISKLFDIPFLEVNEVTKKMEEEARDAILAEINYDQKLYEFTYEKAKQYSPSFRDFLSKYPQVEENLKDLYKQIKTVSRHAGGICIVNNAESEMPVIKVKGEDQVPFTQGLTAQHLETFGLVKYDYLGLATLRIIHRCIELILKSENKPSTMSDIWQWYDSNIHPEKINQEDNIVFDKVYRAGNFPSIFQFTETNARNFCTRAKPKSVKDLSTITAIFRPGPLKSGIDKKYVHAANNQQDIVYDHPILEDVLKETYGFPVFQEQIMMLANKMAGFSLEEADQVRKVLSKPSHEMKGQILEQRKQFREKFIEGCISKGLNKDRAEYLWDEEIAPHCSYSFNKAHSYSYAIISYQCAYLYAYFEKQWIAAVLEKDPDPQNATGEVQNLGYVIRPPDINFSEIDSWQIVGKNCLPPFTAIKAIGSIAASELVQCRNDLGGKFNSLEHFLFKTKEMKTKSVNIYRFTKFNKRCLEAIIQMSGFDSLDIVGQGKMFETYRHMYQALILNFDSLKKGSFNIQEYIDQSEKRDWTTFEKIEIHTSLLGTYDKSLLLDKQTLETFNEYDIQPLSCLSEYSQKIWFLVEDVAQKKTKNGKPFYTLKISDCSGLTKTVNYFGFCDEPIIRNCIYVGVMFYKDGFINFKFKDKIVKISKD